MLSVAYTLLVQGMRIDFPPSYRSAVPKGLKEAGLWAVTACIVHTLAASVATFITIGRMRRQRAGGTDRISDNPLLRNLEVAAWSTVAPLVILATYMFIDNRGFETLFWGTLPFITAFFCTGYLRISVGDWIVVRIMTPLVQSVIMGISSLFLSIILVSEDRPITEWPLIFWIFAAYAVLIAAAIGLTFGEVFKRSLATNVNRLFASDDGTARRGLLFLPSSAHSETSAVDGLMQLPTAGA